MGISLRQPGSYADINDLQLYYEIHGDGQPLVLVHGGGSTIDSTFGRILPFLAKTHRVIAVELQAHGRTRDAGRPLSFEQDADDLAALLGQLDIEKADFLGFSNGGTTCLQVGIRHPGRVNKLVLGSAAYKREGLMNGFFDFMAHATFDTMPQPLKDAFLAVNPDPADLLTSFHRDVARMIAFTDIPDEAVRSIQAPALVINNDQDVVRTEHAIELATTLPNARLAIFPGNHGDYLGECCAANPHSRVPELAAAMIDEFLAS